MEVSDQLFKEIREALMVASKKLDEVNDFCKEVKSVAGIDTDNLCSKIEEVTSIAKLVLKKATEING